MARQRHVRSIAATFALVVLAIAPLALADRSAKKPKKAAKPAASASASASSDTNAAPPTSASAAPAPEPAPEPAPAPSEKPKPDDTKTDAAAEGEAAASGDATNTEETAGKKYYFVGLRYRGTIIPQFLVNLFVDQGGTFYSNTIGAEIDMRKDHQSMIPWIAYTSYGFGDTLFHQKGQPDTDNNYTVVNSGLGAIYLGLDELWSTPIADHLDFEYGFGVGIGVVFGSLKNDWVFLNTPGPLVDNQGRHYTECATTNDAMSCQPSAHQNAQVAKVGGYTEPNWLSGGSIPVVFPHIAVPQLSLRYKPVKQVEARLSAGFSITGFFFGLSVDYGLEKTDEKETPRKTSHTTRLHDTL